MGCYGTEKCWYRHQKSLNYVIALLKALINVLPPLWSSGQSSWLEIQRPGFDSRHYQIFWEVVGLERSPLSLVSTIEELLERKSSGSGLENREYGRWDPSRWPRGTLYPQKVIRTSPKSGGCSVGIVRSRTQTTEFVLFVCWKEEVPWQVFTNAEEYSKRRWQNSRNTELRLSVG
jgi:hypothetical protein